jgi:hypothetical protein
MEVNTNILLGLLFVGILVLLFSKITVSVGSNNNTNNNSTSYQRPIIGNLNHPTTSKSRGRNITVGESQGLPKKDSYMSNSLKNQLNDMENRFYYNNCRWEPNF